jgi:hypothetical protein
MQPESLGGMQNLSGIHNEHFGKTRTRRIIIGITGKQGHFMPSNVANMARIW